MFQTNRPGEALFAVSRAPVRASARESPVTLHPAATAISVELFMPNRQHARVYVHTYLFTHFHAIFRHIESRDRACTTYVHARSRVKASGERERRLTPQCGPVRYGMRRESGTCDAIWPCDYAFVSTRYDAWNSLLWNPPLSRSPGEASVSRCRPR